MDVQLSSVIGLIAMEMEHKIPCWGYALRDSNRKLVFVTDTLSNANTIKLAEKADVLIHEATFQHRNWD